MGRFKVRLVQRTQASTFSQRRVTLTPTARLTPITKCGAVNSPRCRLFGPSADMLQLKRTRGTNPLGAPLALYINRMNMVARMDGRPGTFDEI